MELVLKSRLSDLAPHLGPPDQQLGVLLVYEDIGCVNSTVELLRDAAGRMEATDRLFCTIWGFDFFEDPLLTPIASREAAAADIVVIAQRYWAGLPTNTKAWLGLWASLNNGRPTEIRAADFLSQLLELGRLGGINLLAAGRKNVLVAAELIEVVQRVLAQSSHEFLERGTRCLKRSI